MRAANVTRVSKWGESRRYYFNNGYGASVIRGPYTPRGIWDLSVLRMAADGRWLLCITTPITDDVIGHLSEDEVDALLDRIEKLPKDGPE